MHDWTEDWDEMAALVGKRVTVIMDKDDDQAQITGFLVSLSADGGFVIENDTRHHCWPALAMRKAPAM